MYGLTQLTLWRLHCSLQSQDLIGSLGSFNLEGCETLYLLLKTKNLKFKDACQELANRSCTSVISLSLDFERVSSKNTLFLN